MLPAKRSKKTTLRQYEIMLDFLENHPEMIGGRITDSFTAQRREELWTDLSVPLNSVSFGPQKTPAKWRRTWIDIKSETKVREREIKEQSLLGGKSNPPPLPLHLARIKSLIGLVESNGISDQNVKKNNCVDQCSVRIKECFSEEITPDMDELNNGDFEFDNKTSPTIKIENVSDAFSTSENTSFENACDIPSTSAESSCEKVPDILTTYAEIPCDNMSNISTSPHEQVSDILSTSTSIPCETVSDITSKNAKIPSENAFETLTAPGEIHSNNSSDSLSKKTSCERVCDILTTSVIKLNDVIKNSETRTITALNALTKATFRSNELQEKQLQIEEERNKLYQQRNDILSTLVNAFVEKKVNHQC